MIQTVCSATYTVHSQLKLVARLGSDVFRDIWTLRTNWCIILTYSFQFFSHMRAFLQKETCLCLGD